MNELKTAALAALHDVTTDMRARLAALDPAEDNTDFNLARLELAAAESLETAAAGGESLYDFTSALYALGRIAEGFDNCLSLATDYAV